ncbi:MAG: 3-phosphoshikimate 1-carboxyvinyltransferase [Deltaproteobacteria bacterium]|nr:3-phosphoshikimate 1-carboxyvinyltransferase [Deltaproteobacteria bacterium]
MILKVEPAARLQGRIAIPASKSHTIRAVLIAALADGTSVLHRPLVSEDTQAAIDACRALGARIVQSDDRIEITGFGPHPVQPITTLDMLNSGTSTNLMLGVLAALGMQANITGDASLQSRPVQALTDALQKLGCSVIFHARPGCPPLSVRGRMRGGSVVLDASKSSQYVSSLVIACPLAQRETEIIVENPSELPYIDMTLAWLDEQGISYTREGYTRFVVPGNQRYRAFEKTIPADWSSAAFPLCAAALTDSDVYLDGLDLQDVQGDKAIVDYLRQMGTDISETPEGLRVRGRSLKGCRLDINATPDALPALAVMGCFADGQTILENVAQARVKETDRIAVMARELQKMGARVTELPDGLVIDASPLQGTAVNGHHDHRVVMALAIAGLRASGTTTIDTAEAVAVTYPSFVPSMQQLGARIETI